MVRLPDGVALSSWSLETVHFSCAPTPNFQVQIRPVCILLYTRLGSLLNISLNLLMQSLDDFCLFGSIRAQLVS